MHSRQAASQALDESLRRKQRKHAKLLARVEKTFTRLERRKAKLRALEAGIADLEHQVAEVGSGHAGSVSARLRQAQLIYNPAAGKDPYNPDRLGQLLSALRAHGIEGVVGVKTSGKSAQLIAREAVAAHMPLVVVAAGDGTIAEVAAELIGRPTVLGIIPIGTMNNVARSLGVPLDVDQACALLGMDTRRHIDVGRVVANDDPRVEYFLEGAGVGLSAIAAVAGQGFEKRRWHVMPRVLRKLFESQPGTLRIAMDDEVIDAHSQIVTVSNSPMLGNNMLVAPDAKMDDGLLDVVVYDGLNEATLVKHFLAASGPSPERLKTYRTRHVRITSSEPMDANTDKNVRSRGQVIDIEIAPRALTVIAGNGIGLTVPVDAAPGIGLRKETASHTNGKVGVAAGVRLDPSAM